MRSPGERFAHRYEGDRKGRPYEKNQSSCKRFFASLRMTLEVCKAAQKRAAGRPVFFSAYCKYFCSRVRTMSMYRALQASIRPCRRSS